VRVADCDTEQWVVDLCFQIPEDGASKLMVEFLVEEQENDAYRDSFDVDGDVQKHRQVFWRGKQYDCVGHSTLPLSALPSIEQFAQDVRLTMGYVNMRHDEDHRFGHGPKAAGQSCSVTLRAVSADRVSKHGGVRLRSRTRTRSQPEISLADALQVSMIFEAGCYYIPSASIFILHVECCIRQLALVFFNYNLQYH